MHRLSRLLLVCVFLLTSVGAAGAVNPDEVLENPVLEQRARELSVQIRCLVCQNQSIDDSDAQLARDLRVLVREQLVEGKTDRQILDYLVERYGEFVLLKPIVSQRTWVLWGGPFIFLLLGAMALFVFSRRRQPPAVAVDTLSKEERKRLSQILDEEDR